MFFQECFFSRLAFAAGHAAQCKASETLITKMFSPFDILSLCPAVDEGSVFQNACPIYAIGGVDADAGCDGSSICEHVSERDVQQLPNNQGSPSKANSWEQTVEKETFEQILKLLGDVNDTPDTLRDEFARMAEEHTKYRADPTVFTLLLPSGSHEAVGHAAIGRIDYRMDGGFLNDVSMVLYIQLLMAREQHLRQQLGDKHDKCHIFNSRDTNQLTNKLGGYGPEAIARQLAKKEVSLAGCKRVLFVFNIFRTHYVVVAANKEERTVITYDPMDRKSRAFQEPVIELLDLLEKKESEGGELKMNPSPWKCKKCPRDTRMQPDGVSCGVYCCLYMNMLSLGTEPSSSEITEVARTYRDHIGALLVCLFNDPLVQAENQRKKAVQS